MRTSEDRTTAAMAATGNIVKEATAETFETVWNAAVTASSKTNPMTVKLLDNVTAVNGSFGLGYRVQKSTKE